MTPGESVYGEKRISVAGTNAEGEEEKVEYRVWNPFRSKLAAGILGGLDQIHVSTTSTRTSAARACASVAKSKLDKLDLVEDGRLPWSLNTTDPRSNPEPRSSTSVPPLDLPSLTLPTLSAQRE